MPSDHNTNPPSNPADTTLLLKYIDEKLEDYVSAEDVDSRIDETIESRISGFVRPVKWAFFGLVGLAGILAIDISLVGIVQRALQGLVDVETEVSTAMVPFSEGFDAQLAQMDEGLEDRIAGYFETTPFRIGVYTHNARYLVSHCETLPIEIPFQASADDTSIVRVTLIYSGQVATFVLHPSVNFFADDPIERKPVPDDLRLVINESIDLTPQIKENSSSVADGSAVHVFRLNIDKLADDAPPPEIANTNPEALLAGLGTGTRPDIRCSDEPIPIRVRIVIEVVGDPRASET